MTAIPLGKQAYKRNAGFVPETELLNLYVEKDESGSTGGILLLQRPSLVRQATFGAATRGVFQQEGVLSNAKFVVAGNQLYNAGTVIGTVPGTDLVEFAATYFGLYLASGGALFYTDGVTTTPITVPDGRYVQSIDTLDGYILIFNPDGRFYWVVPGETTIDALNFATAESSPDGGVAVRRLVDEVWFFGTSSVEPWQATGDADAPFQRASGRVYDRGALARDTVRRFDNGIIWVGDDGIVYRTSNVPQAVSTNGIEERIRLATDGLSAITLDSNGHKFWTLKIPGQGDFAYDARSGVWSQFASPGSGAWAPRCSSGPYLVGGSSLWTLSADAANDDTGPYRKAVTGTVPILGKPIPNASASFSVGSSANTVFRLRWRDADEAFPDYWEEFDVQAPADVFSLWRMGRVRQPYRTFEIDNIDGVRVRFSDATLNEAYS